MVGTNMSKRVSHKRGRDTRTKAQAWEFEVNSILWAVVFRPVLSEESKKTLYMALYVCVRQRTGDAL